MRKLRIFEHISLDGVIAPRGHKGDYDNDYTHGGWTNSFRSPAGGQMVAEAMGTSFDLLLGRRTYDLWASYWPTIKTGPFAERINGATKFVATHRPESLTWGPVESLGTDLLAGVRRVLATPGPDVILWGSSTLTTQLMEYGLASEIVLIVYPVLLGPGKRFISEVAQQPQRLELVGTQSTPTGVFLNTYRQVGALPTT